MAPIYSGSLQPKKKIELQEIALALRISDQGTKDELVQRITKHLDFNQSSLEDNLTFTGLFSRRKRSVQPQPIPRCALCFITFFCFFSNGRLVLVLRCLLPRTPQESHDHQFVGLMLWIRLESLFTLKIYGMRLPPWSIHYLQQKAVMLMLSSLIFHRHKVRAKV